MGRRRMVRGPVKDAHFSALRRVRRQVLEVLT